MDIDNEELLRRTYALAKENNKLIKKIRRGAIVSGLFRLMFWAVMIGLPIWMYFTFLQPILQQGMNTFEQVQGVVGQVQELSGQAGSQVTEVQGLIDSIPGLEVLKQLTPQQ